MSSEFEPVGVAVVGCGNISERYGRRMLSRPELITVTGAFDIDRGRELEFVKKCGGRPYQSLEELLSDERVEIVVNLTTHSSHAPVTAAALEAGKHVHSEKPLATTREDGKRLLKLARKNDLRLSCSPFTFLGEGQRTAWRAVREGSIGTVLMAYAEMNWGRIETWHPNPESFYLPGAGPLLDAGVYALTLLTAILGPVERVKGDAALLLPQRTIRQGPRRGETFQVATPDQVSGFLDLVCGARTRLTASFLGFSRQDGIEFHGEVGSLHLSSCHDFDATVEIRTVDSKEWRQIPYVEEPYRGVDWGRAVFDLARSIRTGRPHACTGEHAYHVLDVCLSVLESAEKERPVTVASRFQPPEPS